jgi:hypothetical protein
MKFNVEGQQYNMSEEFNFDFNNNKLRRLEDAGNLV